MKDKISYASPEVETFDLKYELPVATSWHDANEGNSSLHMDQNDDIEDFS